jgi:L-threonylcarbamoyladenylate synthase
VLRLNVAAPEPGTIEEAATLIRRGRLVAFPTESFYGLGADAIDEASVSRVFRAKGRPESKPVLVLVDSIAMAEELVVVGIPARVRELMARYWPGPLTIVLEAPAVPPALTGGTGTLGMRLPAHLAARALVTAAGRPVTAPSANPTGAAPPTTAAEVLSYFRTAVDLVLDGGATPGGPASTVVDCTSWPPRVLRRGPVVLEPIEP